MIPLLFAVAFALPAQVDPAPSVPGTPQREWSCPIETPDCPRPHAVAVGKIPAALPATGMPAHLVDKLLVAATLTAGGWLLMWRSSTSGSVSRSGGHDFVDDEEP